ncbi:MAG: MFS transporter [Corynebacterium sp.]|uniref:MFS transporter n=1 Tax=unclassified Corynebacterium TaxID=2624378 RepID=UPI002649A336|nr:MFS transporter [Corynebacterium sp.]MDN5581971.1 MFS transporter [Corynebacterium sp.]MDN5720125.1 MFS transporter [Corynebacterium sp.]
MPTTRRRQSMFVAAFGTIVEWYDFSIFFYVSASLANTFFNGNDGSLLLTLALGAAGFVFRPLGAMVFGHLGDRIGRKSSLIVSASLMAVALAGIAVMPGFDTIGIWGGVGVLVLRCVAGFAVGAEYTGIMVYLVESARDGRRGLAASWAAANSEVGSLLAVGGGYLMARFLSAEDLDAWGWRVLFLVGALLAAVMVPMRRLMDETETFTEVKDTAENTARSPLVTVLRTHPRAVLVAFLVSSVGSAAYFLNITNVPTYLETTASIDSSTSLWLGTVAAVVAILVTPLAGVASDRFGRRPVFIFVGVVILATTIPAYMMLGGGTGSTALLGGALLAVPAAGWSAVAASAVPEQFTAVGRFSGMAIGYNTATVLFGGLSPFVATWLMTVTGSPYAPAWYAVAIIVFAGIPMLLLFRDRAHVPLDEINSGAADG